MQFKDLTPREAEILDILPKYGHVLGDRAWMALGFSLSTGNPKNELDRIKMAVRRINEKIEPDELRLIQRGSLTSKPMHFPVFRYISQDE